MHKAKEDLLVIAAQNGNEQAFTFLCKHYHIPLSRFAFKLCGDQEMAQDALQNAWIKLTKNLRSLDDPRAFKSWIFKSVRWSTYDLMRKMKKDGEVFAQEILVEDVDVTNYEDIGGPRELNELIDKLPQIDKQAIYLFYLEDMKINEISEVMQIPAGTVKSRLNRARKTLKAQSEAATEK